MGGHRNVSRGRGHRDGQWIRNLFLRGGTILHLRWRNENGWGRLLFGWDYWWRRIYHVVLGRSRIWRWRLDDWWNWRRLNWSGGRSGQRGGRGHKKRAHPWGLCER